MNRILSFSSGARALRLAACLAMVALLGACAGTRTAGDGRTGTVLMSVVVANKVSPDFQATGLVVQVEQTEQGLQGQFAFKPTTAVPRSSTEFLVRLDVPRGPYKITHLLGTAGAGESLAQFALEVRVPFEVQPGETVYLGQLVLTNEARSKPGQPSMSTAFSDANAVRAGFVDGAATLAVQDAYANSLPAFVQAWPPLRGVEVQQRLIVHAEPVSPNIPVATSLDQPRGEHVPPQKLDKEDAAEVPAKLQPAFQRFLKSRYPRAMVIADGNRVHLVSGGSNVIQRAMTACKSVRSTAKSCRLFALDDTLVGNIATPSHEGSASSVQ